MSSENSKPFDMEELKLLLSHTRHENMMLKTELLHNIQQQQRDHKEMKLMCSSKVDELEKIIKAMEENQNSILEQSILEQKELQQRNLQLNQKLKISEDELSSAKLDNERLIEEHKKQFSQLKLIVKRKEEEISSAKDLNNQLKEKLVSMEAEVDKTRTRNHELEITLSSERHQMKMMKSRIDEIEQQFYIERNSSYNEIEKYKTQIQTLEKSFQKRCEGIDKSSAYSAPSTPTIRQEALVQALICSKAPENAYLNERVESEKKSHDESEEKFVRLQKDTEKRISDLKQVHLSETETLLQENEKLLKRIQILQQNQSDFADRKKISSEQMVQLPVKVGEITLSRSKEQFLLNSKLKECEELINLLDEEKNNSTKLHQEIGEIVTQLKKIQKENNDLQTINKALDKSLSDKEKLLSSVMQDLQKDRSLHQQMLGEATSKGEDQIAEQRSRILYLESHLSKKASEYLRETAAQKEKIKQYGALIKKLRFRLEVAGVKERELEAKHEVLKQDFVPSYQYRQMQQSLQHIINKHSEFKAFIQGLGNKQENFNQVEELSHRMSSINEKLLELEGVQKETYAALESL